MERFPRTLELLADATISVRHARALVDAAGALDDAVAYAVETRVLRRAAGSTVSEFRRTVRRVVAALDPRKLEDRHRDAMTERRVVCTDQDDGMSELWALLPTDAAARVMGRLNRDAEAARNSSDGRTADQRRADGLVTLIDPRPGSDLGAASDSAASVGGEAAAGRSAGPSVHLTVALTTVLGLDDQPGELAGHGPVPATVARRIAADPSGTWRRIVTDPLAGIMDVSRAYRPPPAMQRHVTTRDRTCRFPGCRRTATTCELDHITAWDGARGGPTAPANLHPLCRRHHHLKHEAPGWRVTRKPDGVTTWQLPGGRTIHVEPDRYDDWEDTAYWPGCEAGDDGTSGPDTGEHDG